MQNSSDIKIAPAPWSLTGNAYVMVYKFPKEFIHENSFMEEYQRKRFLGYLGTVILVDYHTSNVGKYYELLFIPGMFTFDWEKVFSISKIYVSSEDSIFNGNRNWGIPKEKADFEWIRNDLGRDEVTVKLDGNPIFEIQFNKSYLNFPIKSNFYSFKLAQKSVEDLMITRFNFKGTAKLSKINKVKVDKKYFPETSSLSALFTFQLNDFQMDFGVPNIKKDYFK